MQNGYAELGAQRAQTAAEYNQQMHLQQLSHQQISALGRPPEPPGAIQGSLLARRAEIETLHQSLDELEKRLSTVMRPVPPSGNNAQSQPTPVRSQVADALEQLGGGVMAAHGRVLSMLERLEV